MRISMYMRFVFIPKRRSNVSTSPAVNLYLKLGQHTIVNIERLRLYYLLNLRLCWQFGFVFLGALAMCIAVISLGRE